jgi:hypothetical protein
MKEETVIHQGKKVWYLVEAEGIQQETWKPGHLYLTNKRLFWWNNFEEKLVFDIPVDKVISIGTEMGKIGGIGNDKEKILNVEYQVNSSEKTASFTGREIDKWEQVLSGVVAT